MRKRKLRWVVGLALAVLIAAGTFTLWPKPDEVPWENYKRIEIGMSRTEVEAILGPPSLAGVDANSWLKAGRHDPDAWDHRNLVMSPPYGWHDGEKREHRLWLQRSGILAVSFADGGVAVKVWLPRVSWPEYAHRKVRRLLP
jgi:hypothetical protein